MPHPRRATPQLELFPTPVEIVPLDPRQLIGPRTRVLGLFQVRIGTEPRAHPVFHDRHGWYCEEHGPACAAAAEARARHAS